MCVRSGKNRNCRSAEIRGMPRIPGITGTGKGIKKMAKMNVDFEACKGCALCTTACPKKIVEISHEKLNAKGYYTAVCIDDDACIACAMCAMMCPDCAITIIPDGGEK